MFVRSVNWLETEALPEGVQQLNTLEWRSMVNLAKMVVKAKVEAFRFPCFLDNEHSA